MYMEEKMTTATIYLEMIQSLILVEMTHTIPQMETNIL